ncbi:transposase-like protein [Rhizobium mongolense]
MNNFKWRHFQGEIILWAVRWYCRYGVSYRDLEQMMGERGVPVDHSTIYRWVQNMRRRWKSGYAGTGAGRNRRAGVSTKPM